MVVISVPDRHSLRNYYVAESQRRLLRVSGFNHVEIGQAVDCAISFEAESVVVQSQGIVVSRGVAPGPGVPLGIEVELVPRESRTHDVIEGFVQGEATLTRRRRSPRYHAAIEIEYPNEADLPTDFVQDISLEGAAIRSHRQVESAASLPLRLKVPACAPIDVTGEVRWSRRGEDPAFGVHFIFSTSQQRERMGDLIADIENTLAGFAA